MSEPARKPEIDTAEFERRLRQPAPRAPDDPLAELARLVSAPVEPRRAQPIDALSNESRAALTHDEQDFLNELSLAIDRARAPSPVARAPGAGTFQPEHREPRGTNPEAGEDALERAEQAIRRAAADAREAVGASRAAPQDEPVAPQPASFIPQPAPVAPQPAPAAPQPAAPQPAPTAPQPAPAAVEFPALKLKTGLRGGLDMQGLEAMTRLEDIARDAPARPAGEAPALPKVDLSAPVFPRPHAEFPTKPVASPQDLPFAQDFDAPQRGPRDLDAPLPGDDGFETAAPAPVGMEPPPPRRNRRAMAALVAVVGVGVAAVGVAMTMKRGPRAASGEPPTIMASADPVKVAPPAAPAAPSDQADTLLARKQAGAKPDAGAKVVGRAEEPVDLAREAQKIVRTVPIAPAAQDAAIPRTPTGDSVQPDRLGSVFPEPKRVRTVSIRPDGSVIGGDAPPPPPIAQTPAPLAAPPLAAPKPAAPRAETATATPAAREAPASSALAEDKPAAPRPRAATPAAQTPAAQPPAPRRVEKPAPAPKPAAEKVEKPVQARPAPARRPAPAETDAEPQQIAAAPAPTAGDSDVRAPSEGLPNPFAALFGRKDQPAPAPVTTASTNAAADDDEAPAKPAARTAVGSGAFAVQLSSSPSESDARAAASRLGGRFSGQLGGRAARVVKGEAGGKTVYRVRAGGMSKEGAVSACESIKSSGGSCFVAHD